MIKKTKDAVSLISEKIQNDFEYNMNLVDGYTPIKLTSIEISRGLMNHIRKNEEFMMDVYGELLLAYGEGFEYKVQDNDDSGCYLFIYYK